MLAAWRKLRPGDQRAVVAYEVAAGTLVGLMAVLWYGSADTAAVVFAVAICWFFAQIVLVAAIAAISAFRTARVPASQRPPVDESVKSLVRTVLVLVCLVGAFKAAGFGAVYEFPESVWAYRLLYAFEDDLESADYLLDRRPRDCDFLTAPLGAKNCRYVPQVTTVRVRRQDGSARVSYDGGRSWRATEGRTRRAVVLTWMKVDD